MHIEDSPFEIQVAADIPSGKDSSSWWSTAVQHSTTQSDHTDPDGPKTLRCKAGGALAFTVTVRDRFGNRCCGAGAGARGWAVCGVCKDQHGHTVSHVRAALDADSPSAVVALALDAPNDPGEYLIYCFFLDEEDERDEEGEEDGSRDFGGGAGAGAGANAQAEGEHKRADRIPAALAPATATALAVPEVLPEVPAQNSSLVGGAPLLLSVVGREPSAPNAPGRPVPVPIPGAAADSTSSNGNGNWNPPAGTTAVPGDAYTQPASQRGRGTAHELEMEMAESAPYTEAAVPMALDEQQLRLLQQRTREETTRSRAREALRRELRKLETLKIERRRARSARRTGGGFVIQYSKEV